MSHCLGSDGITAFDIYYYTERSGKSYHYGQPQLVNFPGSQSEYSSIENPKPRIENTAVSTREVTEVTCETYASGHEGAKRLIIDIVGIRPN